MDTHSSKPKPHRQHTLLFPSPLTPGGHLQILISADLSKLQHRPNFHNRAKWSSCEWLHKRWTKYEKIDILISLCLTKQELYLITFILQLRCPFWKASVIHCSYTNSWNDQNESYYTEYWWVSVWGDLAEINKIDVFLIKWEKLNIHSRGISDASWRGNVTAEINVQNLFYWDYWEYLILDDILFSSSSQILIHS